MSPKQKRRGNGASTIPDAPGMLTYITKHFKYLSIIIAALIAVFAVIIFSSQSSARNQNTCLGAQVCTFINK